MRPRFSFSFRPRLRSRLVHALSLWLLGAVCASVLAMGAFTAWNLRQGFSAYLQARDLERLELLAQVLVQDMARSGSAQAWLAQPPNMRALLRQHATLDGVVMAGPADPANAADADTAPDGRPTPGPGRPPMAPPPHTAPGLGTPPERPQGPPPQPPPPGGGDRFGSRVALYLPASQRWVGPPSLAREPGLIERPVSWKGEVVAVLKLRPMEPLPEDNEVRFLRAQYQGIAVLAAGLVLLALACAWWLARQWARPLVAVQHATQRIAQGELAVRLPSDRSDEIGDVMRNVNHMAESLQRLEGTRRRWMADLSHELRTPLAVLRGEIEALVDGVRPLNAQAMLSLREDVLRLGALVDDLHLLAMADLQALPCRMADMDATEVVQTAMDRCQRRASQAGLSLAWASPPPAELWVCWDEARLQQLLTNLIENSLRYTDAPGCVRLALGPSQTDSGWVQLTISDSAPGVSAADMPHVFEPLYRVDVARSRPAGHGGGLGHTPGSGLGLAIVAAIVESHHGRVRAQSSPLGGLCVVVDLPVSAVRPPQEAA